jgi:ABC-type sugar transport system substrate-binding protein
VRYRGVMITALAVLAIAVGLTACGGGGGSSSSSSGSTSEETTSGEEGNAAAIAEVTERPTAIPVTKPVGKSIPSGKTIAYIPSSSPSAIGPVKAEVEAAAKVLGWKVETFTPTGATATAALAAFEQAIKSKPDGLIYWSFPQAEIGRELTAAKEAGIPVVAANTGEPVGTLPGVIAQPANTSTVIKLESAGARLMGLLTEPGKGMTFIELTGFIPVGPVVDAVEKEATKACPTCEYKLKEINITQLGEATQLIANYLRSEPNIKTAFLVDYATFGVGLPAQLSAVGVSGVQVISSDLEEQGLEEVKDGSTFVGGSIFPFTEASYLSVDALARNFVGESSEVDNVPMEPYWFTTENAPATAGNEVVEGAAKQFEELWGK